MTTNTLFFSQEAVDQWMIDGVVRLDNNELTMLPAGHRYELTEAFRIVREVSGAADQNALVGKVKGRALLEGLGAELAEASMLLGDNAYDVVAGWFGIPVDDGASASPPLKLSVPNPTDPSAVDDDSRLLAQFLLRNLN